MRKISKRPPAKNPLRQILKKLALLCLTIPLVLATFRSYEEVSAPPYDRQSMPLYREVMGTGHKRLVLVHGLSGSTSFWRARLGSMVADHRILLVDLLGFGKSPKPDADYSLQTRAGALRDVMRQEGFLTDNTTVVGHSLGALVVTEFLSSEHDLKVRGVLMEIPIYQNQEDAKAHLSQISLMHRAMVEDSKYMHLTCYFRLLGGICG